VPVTRVDYMSVLRQQLVEGQLPFVFSGAPDFLGLRAARARQIRLIKPLALFVSISIHSSMYTGEYTRRPPRPVDDQVGEPRQRNDIG
jgi:hypothetical protein